MTEDRAQQTQWRKTK